METKDTLSSCSDLEEQEIQQLQMQAESLKDNTLNKLNALKTTTQCLERQTFTHSPLFQQAFAYLFHTDVITFKYELSQNMNNLEKQLNNEILHEKDSKSTLSVIKVQFDKFIHSNVLKSIDPYSSSASYDREQCIVERGNHEHELQNGLKRLNETKLQIQECKVQEVQSPVASSGGESSSGIISDEGNDQSSENQSNTSGDESSMSWNDCNETSNSGDDIDISPSYDTEPMVEVPYSAKYNVFVVESQHSEQPESISNTCVVETVDRNVIPDSSNMCINDDQIDQNAVEYDDERYKTNLEETTRALGESTSCRDSCLIALQTKQTELERYMALNDRTLDYEKLQSKLNETLGLLARKDNDIKEGLKLKAYEILVFKQKYDDLVKQSLLTKSSFEGRLKDKNKVILDLKVKEGKDIDKMIAMDKQLKFLNKIIYKRNQTIQTIHMLAPKCSKYNDLANKFAPDWEETITLEKESRSKLDKDLVKPYDYTKQNSLYENFKPPSQEYLDQLAHAKEVRKKMWRKSFVKTKPNIVKNIACLPVSKSVSSNDMVNNYCLEEAKKNAQLQKDKDVKSKPSVITLARLPNTASGCKLKPRISNQQPRNWPASMSSRVSNKDVHIAEKPRKQKPFLKSKDLPCKGDSEPTTGSNVDIYNVHVCKQTLDISAGTSITGQQKQRIDLYDGTSFNVKQENLRSSVVSTADASDQRQQQPDSTSSTSSTPTISIDGNFDLGSWKPKPGALSLYVGDGHRAAVKAIREVHLCLPSGLVLILNNCHYAPSITRGIILVSCLYKDGFVNRFENDNSISISRNNLIYFNAIPRDDIYEIVLSSSNTNDSSMYAVSNKRAKLNLDFALLWHCRLGHISKKHTGKLQHDGLLDSTDIKSFEKCVSCMSGKMARKPYSHQVERAKYLLGLIHTDVCGPFKIMSRQGASYFITFIDDFSRYGYVYLLKHKHEVFETFKVFQKEVENQLEKTIKSLRSDRGGEYMSQEFLDNLKEHGIIAHRTSPYTPQHNGVSEKRNQTLLDMVCSMMSQTTLPKSF
ncbi:retrotransposon protein, putative, ty1-copia subclass [Tanacetum coccineum]